MEYKRRRIYPKFFDFAKKWGGEIHKILIIQTKGDRVCFYNFTRTLKYARKDKVGYKIKREMPLYEMKPQTKCVQNKIKAL